MPVRDLTVVLSIIDRGSKILDAILQKKAQLEGKDINVTASVDADTSGAEALEGSLDQLDGAASKVKGDPG
jgi:hypothetical protein